MVCLTAAPLRAQVPAIPPGSPPPAPPAELPSAVAPAPPPPAPPFTPVPVPAFTTPAPVFNPPPPVWTPPPSPPRAPAWTPPTPDSAPRDARYTDAHVDHVVWMPTAETHPAGTAYFSSYELLILQAGYALSDDVQLTLTFIPIASDDIAFPLDVSVKGVVMRSRRVRVAAIGSASGVASFENQPGLLGRAGGVTTLCFDDACRSSASVAANLLMLGNQLIVADAVGGIFRLSSLTALLAEVQSAVPFGRDVGRYNGVGGALGVRLSGARWGVDLSLQVPLTSEDVPRAFPVVAFTYRTAP